MTNNIDNQVSMEMDSFEKINNDTLILTDKVRRIKQERSKTPFYHIIVHIKLWIELMNLKKETEKIGKRLDKIKENPIQIVKRV